MTTPVRAAAALASALLLAAASGDPQAAPPAQPAASAQPATTGPTAPAPHVSQVLSGRQVKLGEPFALDVAVTHPVLETWEIQVPESMGAFSVLARSSKSARDGGQVTTHWTLKLGLYEPGKHLVPALSLREKASGRVLPLSQDAEVEGVSTLAKDDPLTLRDAAPPRAIFLRDPKKIAAAALGLVGLAALGLLLFRLARKAWRRLFPPESEEARDRRLLTGLLLLDDEPFFEALDGILRRSLARWHGVPALESTGEEIVRALGQHPPQGVDLDALASVLRESLLVRFAHRPTSQVRKRAAVEVCTHLFPAPKGESHARPALP